jgi:hypothetical protein
MGEPPEGAPPDDPLSTRALARCDDLIREYETYWRRRKPLYLGFQSAAVLLAGITPVLLLTGISKALQALPAALAAILGGLVAIYHWQDNVTRCAYAAEALKSERAKFVTRATDRYNNDKTALDNFVAQIEDIRMTEVRGWRADWRQAASDKSDESDQTSTRVAGKARRAPQHPYRRAT